MASGSGRLFYQEKDGRVHSAHDHAFVQKMMEHTTAHLWVLLDGARAHTSASPHAFLVAQSERSTAHPLPSYAPEDTPMA